MHRPCPLWRPSHFARFPVDPDPETSADVGALGPRCGVATNIAALNIHAKAVAAPGMARAPAHTDGLRALKPKLDNFVKREETMSIQDASPHVRRVLHHHTVHTCLSAC